MPRSQSSLVSSTAASATGPSTERAESTFALVLAGSSADAEALLGTLQTALGPAEGEYKLGLSAGVTEIVSGDDGAGALARAEHALWQARQAGVGTVVVALAAPKTPGSA